MRPVNMDRFLGKVTNWIVKSNLTGVNLAIQKCVGLCVKIFSNILTFSLAPLL